MALLHHHFENAAGKQVVVRFDHHSCCCAWSSSTLKPQMSPGNIKNIWFWGWRTGYAGAGALAVVPVSPWLIRVLRRRNSPPAGQRSQTPASITHGYALLDSENFNLVLKALACHPPIASRGGSPCPRHPCGNERFVRARPT
jgi:hypothetical protein